MAFTSTSIAPLMPDISMKLPEQAMMKLADMEGAAHEKNTNSLAKLIEMSQVGLSKITDPEVRKRVEQSLAPMQAKIDDLSNTLVKNPGEFAYMTNYLNSVGLDLAKNFTNGPAGNTIRLFDDIEKRKSEWMKNDPVQAERVFNTSNPYIQEQIKIAEQGGSPTLPSYMKQPNMVDKTRHYLQGVLRDKYQMTNFTIGDDGTITKSDGTIMKYDAELQNNLREALESDPDIRNYYQTMSKADPEAYSDKHVIRINKLGQKVYYGRKKDGTLGETTNEADAFSTMDYEIGNTLNTSNMYTKPATEQNVTVTPEGVTSKGTATKGTTTKKETEVTTVQKGTVLQNNPNAKPTTITSLKSNVSNAKSELDKITREYNSIPSNAEESYRKNVATRLATAKYAYQNLKTEQDEILKHSWNTSNLSTSEKEIYRKYSSNPNVLFERKREALRAYNASGRDPKYYSAYENAEKELKSFNRAKDIYNSNISKNLSQWYPSSSTQGTHTMLENNSLEIGKNKELNNFAQTNISAGKNGIIVNGGKTNYEEFEAATVGVENYIQRATVKDGKLIYETKPLPNGKKYILEVNDNNARKQFFNELSNGNYDSDTKLIGYVNSDPDAKRIIRLAGNTKKALDTVRNSGPERKIRIEGGFELSLKKTKNGYIKVKVVAPNGTIATKNPSGDYAEITDSNGNKELALLQYVQAIKQGYTQ